jgi:hypothetical protein
MKMTLIDICILNNALKEVLLDIFQQNYSLNTYLLTKSTKTIVD